MSASYEPHELSQVEFKDDEDAVEEGQLHVDFADKDALLDHLDLPMVRPTRRRSGRPWFKLMCVLVPILGAIGTGLYFILTPNSSNSSSSTTSTSAVYLEQPPSNIASKCTSDSDECRMVCEPAECCTFPSNLALSCLAGNEDKCLVYHKYCSILDGGEQLVASAEQIPRAPTNLNSVCTTDKIATVDGFQECQEACQPASCCYDDHGDIDTCNNDECADYAPCLILSVSDKIHEEIPKHVADQCDHLEDFVSRSACRVACSHALCCFYKDKNTCPQPDASFCDQYSVCNDLEVDVNVVADAAEVTMICNSYHTSMCEVVCERGACCFAKGGCPTSDINCADYMTCANIYGDSPDDDNGVQGGSATGTEEGGTNTEDDDSGGVIFKADVDDACLDLDPAKESTTDSKCAKLCADAECCFTQSGCDNEINCGVYKECDIIYATLLEAGSGGDGGNGSKTDGDGDDNLGIVFKVDVDDACISYDPGADGSDQALCPKLCADAACCFHANGCTTDINCYTYAECDVLFGNDGGGASLTGLRATASEIIEACDTPFQEAVVNSDGETLCHALCNPFNCCFSNCTKPSGIDCTVGAGCAPLHKYYNPESGSASENKAQLYDIIMAACEVDSDMVDCKALCIDGRCCFESQNCEAPSSVTCDDYKGCLVIYAVDGEDNGADSTKVETQAPTSTGEGGDGSSELYNVIMTACEVDSDMEDCKSLCVDGRCCFESQNCEAPSGITCDDYKGCLVVYAVDDGDDSTGASGIETQAPTSTGDGGDGSSELYDIIMTACEVDSDMEDCKSLCVDGRCCFESQNCEAPSGITCDDYKGCLVVYAVDDGDDGTGASGVETQAPTSSGGASDNEIGSLYTVVMAACEDGGDMQECESVCSDGRCCFESQNCQAPSGISCSNYAGCSTIYAGDGGDSAGTANPNDYTADDIAAACSESAAISMCNQMCSGSECCFNSDLSCHVSVDCDTYDACSKLWTR